jgi:colicin import membrane protein
MSSTTLQPRHIVIAALLHVALFAMLFTGVQCSQHIQPTPVMQGVLINPSQLQHMKPPQPNPAPPKPDEVDQGPQKQVTSDVVADQAKEQQEKAAALQKQQQELQAQQAAAAKAAEEQRKAEAAKAEELRKSEEAQKQAAEQAAAQKKQQEEQAKAKAEAAAAAQKAQEQKDREEQLRKEAQEQQEAQQAMLNQKKKAEEARQAAERRRQAQQEMQKELGVASAQLSAEIQSQWATQLVAALAAAWARPPGTDSSLKAFVLMTLAPNGQVQNAQIDTGSGVPAFDDSVVRAAYAASPMPLPADPSAFRSKVDVCFSPNPRNCQ